MLEIKNLYFSYDKEDIILNHINFSIQKGEFVTIIGESGCGKSTFMKLIFGLYNWEEGEIYFNNIQLLGPKRNLVPGEKTMKYVAQDFNLMPNHTVYDNVGKFISNCDLEKKKKLVTNFLKVVEMNDFSSRKIKYLSGGQQQRVALAISLSQQPKLLLLDEPFSQIDNFRRSKLRNKIFNYVKRKKISVLLITHDKDDALGYSDRIIVMKDGKFIQEGTPKKVYENPKNQYVAKLFGDVNIVNNKLFGRNSNYVYYHQLIESNTGIKVEVISSLYKGSEYVIGVKCGNKRLYYLSKINKNIGDKVILNLV